MGRAIFMRSATEETTAMRIWFYVGALILVMSVWGIQVYVYDNVFLSGPQVLSESSNTPSAPTDWQKMSVQAMSETNGLLTTLATAVLGALGLLLGRKVKADSEPRHVWAAFLAAIAAGLSLYFGYVSHLNLLWMINNQAFGPGDSLYQFSSHAQFYTLLTGAFFLADFAVHDLNRE